MKASGLPTTLSLLLAAAATVTASHADSHRIIKQAHRNGARGHPNVVTVTATQTGALPTMASDCPTAITMTTTVDVTTTIFPTFSYPNATTTSMSNSTTTPCDDDDMTATTTAWSNSTAPYSEQGHTVTMNSTMTAILNGTLTTSTMTASATTTEEPCDDDTMTATATATSWANSTGPYYTEKVYSTRNMTITASINGTLTTATMTASATTTEEPCDDDGMTVTTSATATTTEEPCTDSTTTTTSATTTEEPCTDSTTTASATVTADEEPCTDFTTTTSATVTASPTAYAMNNTTISTSTSASTTDCDDDMTATASSTVAADTIRVTLTSATTYPTVTPFFLNTTSTTYQMTELPISTATVETTTTFSLPPTTTLCATSAPTGTPAPRAVHCGVHGLPVGDFFLGQFVESEANVPVSLETCWLICNSVWGVTHGCASYDFYLNELSAPRCDLYGSPVAYALDKVDNLQPNTWFDLECGDPMAAQWSHEKVAAGMLRRARRGLGW